MQFTQTSFNFRRNFFVLALVTIPYGDSAPTMILANETQNTFNFNLTTILNILSKLNFVSLHASDAAEMENNFVQFLLTQQVCPLQLYVGSSNTFQMYDEISASRLKFYIASRHRVAVTSADDIETTITQLISRGGYLICLILGDMDAEKIKEVAELLWQRDAINRVYYFTSQNAWYYNPFTRIGDEFGALHDANREHITEILGNFNGYTLRTYIFDSVYSSVDGNATARVITKVRGADSEAALLLSEKLNFTMELQWPDDEFFGARLDNGSYNGAIGRLIRSETDAVLTGFFVKDYLTRDIAFTVSIYMDELCCYVMKAPRIPQSILPLFAVRVDIWVGFFLVGFLSPIIWMSMRQFNTHFMSPDILTKGVHQCNHQYARIFIDTWVVWVRVNILHFPPYYSERIFVISLCLVSVIYGALFESSLATVYIRPLYYKDINTLQELDDANFRIYIKHAAMKDDLFFGHSSRVYQDLNQKLLLVAETEERLISMMSKRGGFAAVTRASSLVLDDIHYFITNKIHKIPECPKNYHIAFVLPIQSPYEETFNVYLLRFLEAGLPEQWIDVMKHQAKTKIHTSPDYKAEDDHWKVLTLKDLQLAFYALGFGCTISLLSLLGEFGLKLKKVNFRSMKINS